MAAIASQATEAVKNWFTFHHENFSNTQIQERDTASSWETHDSRAVLINALVHDETRDLYAVQGGNIPSMDELAKKNIAVGAAFGLAPWYFAAHAVKDTGVALYHTAMGCTKVYRAYKNQGSAFNYTTFFSTTVPAAFDPAVSSGMHAAKNYAAFSFLSGATPTILGFSWVLGAVGAAYGYRNPLNFRDLFTRFDAWWSPASESIEPARVKLMNGKDKAVALVLDTVRISQFIFPEPITKVGNLDTSEYAEGVKRFRQHGASTPVSSPMGKKTQ